MSVKKGVGVVIGRFQVHKLHAGHHALFRAANQHDKLLVCIGVGRQITPRDPLDYPTRERMIKQCYTNAIVVPLPDQPTDSGWSSHLDKLIHIMFPTDPVVMYCGRESFSTHYKGGNKVWEIEAVPDESGTSLRDSVNRFVLDSEEFRCGCIYGATNQLTRIDAAVDICMFKRDEVRGIVVLVGRRHNEEGLYRLPGGHVEHTDRSAEAAARRELMEETGLEAEEWEILDNVRITSLDAPGFAMFTTLFLAEYVHGEPVLSPGELDEIVWVPLSSLKHLRFADNHEQLIEIACATLREI